MLFAHESDVRCVGVVLLLVDTENVKVWIALPKIATIATDPVNALVVVNATVPEVDPLAIVSVDGAENAVLLDFRVTIVEEVAGVLNEMRQLPEIPGERTAGVQDGDKSFRVSVCTREMEAVAFAVPSAAVITALWEAVMVAADAVNVAEVAPATTGRVPGTAN
jgi:hypothetical protein